MISFDDDEDQHEAADFMAAFGSGKWPFSVAIPCRICGKKSRNVRHVGFCNQHWVESKRRQAEGVPFEELSTSWGDTLAAWKDRPADIVDEPAELFRYGMGQGDWHLFSRGYEGRWPDWIAYNARTGEVRRFAGVSSEDVMEELLGGNPALNQEELLSHWGTPGPNTVQEIKERMLAWAQRGTEAMPKFSEVVRDYGIPVYGLYGGEVQPVSF